MLNVTNVVLVDTKIPKDKPPANTAPRENTTTKQEVQTYPHAKSAPRVGTERMITLLINAGHVCRDAIMTSKEENVKNVQT